MLFRSDGAHFTPTTFEEKNCFQLLNDLDHVGGLVKGSLMSKKFMQNEIWSVLEPLKYLRNSCSDRLMLANDPSAFEVI